MATVCALVDPTASPPPIVMTKIRSNRYLDPSMDGLFAIMTLVVKRPIPMTSLEYTEILLSTLPVLPWKRNVVCTYTSIENIIPVGMHFFFLSDHDISLYSVVPKRFPLGHIANDIMRVDRHRV